VKNNLTARNVRFTIKTTTLKLTAKGERATADGKGDWIWIDWKSGKMTW